MGHDILIVDDDPDIRGMMVRFLETIGEVSVAATGEEALRLIAARPPRLMLLDVVMPGMSGIEVLKAARDSTGEITIIMLTSEDDVGLAKQCLELGAAEYVTKPFNWRELKEKVKRSLKDAPRDAKLASGLPWRTVVSPDPTEAGTIEPGGSGSPK